MTHALTKRGNMQILPNKTGMILKRALWDNYPTYLQNMQRTAPHLLPKSGPLIAWRLNLDLRVDENVEIKRHTRTIVAHSKIAVADTALSRVSLNRTNAFNLARREWRCELADEGRRECTQDKWSLEWRL